jgi:hypothetical protein
MKYRRKNKGELYNYDFEQPLWRKLLCTEAPFISDHKGENAQSLRLLPFMPFCFLLIKCSSIPPHELSAETFCSLSFASLRNSHCARPMFKRHSYQTPPLVQVRAMCKIALENFSVIFVGPILHPDTRYDFLEKIIPGTELTTSTGKAFRTRTPRF